MDIAAATRSTFMDRPYSGENDLQAVCDLLNLCDAVDKLDDNYAIDDLRLEFDSPHLDKAKDLHLWEDETGRLIGFGQLWIPQVGEYVDGGLYMRVHPDARDTDVADRIIEWASERTREVGRERNQPAKLRGWARESEAFTREALERNGLSLVRYFFKMSRPLDEPIPEHPLPEGYTMRNVSSDEDVERWVEMFNQSFIDHWNHHPMVLEDHKHWLTNPKYKPEGDLIAIAPDGTFAAFCFCWIDPDDNERNNRNEGWIDILGTRRGHRKIGLGRAMLLAGFQYLKSQGIAVAKLGVDAENPTGALRLYESVGFVNTQTSVAYRKDL